MDESVPVAVATGLQRRGVVAVTARDAGNLGLRDEEQLAYASANQMALFTHDADFLRLARQFAKMPGEHWGIIYVHSERLTLGEKIRQLKDLAELFEPDDLRNTVEFL